MTETYTLTHPASEKLDFTLSITDTRLGLVNFSCKQRGDVIIMSYTIPECRKHIWGFARADKQKNKYQFKTSASFQTLESYNGTEYSPEIDKIVEMINNGATDEDIDTYINILEKYKTN